MYLGSVLINFVMQMQAHYVGKLENGKVFDSSYNRGKPLTFRVGVGEVCISPFEYVHNLQQLVFAWTKIFLICALDFPKLGCVSCFQNIDMVAQESYLRSLGDLFVINV